MKKITALFAAFTLATSAGISFAQEAAAESQSGEDQVTSTDDNTRKFFQVKLSDGGAYMVALSRITSIAKHEYIVDGAVKVTEVSVTAEGATITRFYYLEEVSTDSPSSAGQVALDRLRATTKAAAKRTGTDKLLSTVTKSYPYGTHTHNVEYRLRNKANVDQLYQALYNAWYYNKGKRVSIQTKE